LWTVDYLILPAAMLQLEDTVWCAICVCAKSIYNTPTTGLWSSHAFNIFLHQSQEGLRQPQRAKHNIKASVIRENVQVLNPLQTYVLLRIGHVVVFHGLQSETRFSYKLISLLLPCTIIITRWIQTPKQTLSFSMTVTKLDWLRPLLQLTLHSLLTSGLLWTIYSLNIWTVNQRAGI